MDDRPWLGETPYDQMRSGATSIRLNENNRSQCREEIGRCEVWSFFYFHSDTTVASCS